MAKYDKLLKVAEGEIGYLEKKSLSSLDSKTGNAGSSNYTKYARDMAKTDWYNGNKQGFSWCAVFADWCFVQAYGYDTARKMQGYPEKSAAAGVDFAKDYYHNAGRLYSKPKVGDRVFFGTQHTGIVVAVSGDGFTTIEGNTSSGSSVVSNGGGVHRKTYARVQSGWTFGRPDWSLIKEEAVKWPTVEHGDRSGYVLVIQQMLLNKGYSVKVTGTFDDVTEAKVKKHQKKRGLTVDGVVGPKTWATLLG